MAKAGDQYEFRTGNLWSVCRRDDLSTARRLVVDEGLDLEMRNKAGWAPLSASCSGPKTPTPYTSNISDAHALDASPVCHRP